MNHQLKQMAMVAAVAVLACSPAMSADQTSTQEPSSGWFSHLFHCPTWARTVAAANSPNKAAKLVRQHVHFREDIGDEWAEGKTTWDRGFGDCEDFAAAVIQLCKEAGLEVDATIQVFRTTGQPEPSPPVS